jgi:hypothetical protein
MPVRLSRINSPGLAGINSRNSLSGLTTFSPPCYKDLFCACARWRAGLPPFMSRERSQLSDAAKLNPSLEVEACSEFRFSPIPRQKAGGELRRNQVPKHVLILT